MPTNRELSIIMRLRDHATAAFMKASGLWAKSLAKIKAAAIAAMKALKLLATVGIAAVAAAMVLGLRAAGRYMLALDKLTKVTGVHVEQLARLLYAMEQEHGERDTLIKGLMRFKAVQSGVARGMATYTDLLEGIGIAYRDNEGRMVDTVELMMRFSDAYHTGAMSIEQAAFATELLGGRLAKNLIPFLKLGREAIEELGDQAEELGLVIGRDVVQAAKRFDDKMSEVRAGIRGVFVGIKTGLLPHLERLATWFADKMPRIVKRAKEWGDAIGLWITRIKEADTAWRKFIALVTKPPPVPGLVEVDKALVNIREELKQAEAALEEVEQSWLVMPRAVAPFRREVARLGEEQKRLLILQRRLQIEQVAIAEREAQRLKLLGQQEAKAKAAAAAFVARIDEDMLAAREVLELKLLELTEGRLAAELKSTRRHYQQLMEEFPKMLDLILQVKALHLAKLEEQQERHITNIREATAAGLAEAIEGWGNFYAHIERLAKTTVTTMQNVFANVFFDAFTRQLKTAEDYFRAFGKAMLRMISEIIAKLLIELAVRKAIKALTAVSPGIGGIIGKALGLAQGGRIAQGQVQPLPTAQAGAMVARGRAVPIIAHEGEWIGTPARLAAAGIGETAPIFNISINTIDARSFEERLAEHPDVFEGAIINAMTRSRTIRHITRRFA